MSPAQTNLEGLAARVAELEMQNRRWKFTTVLFGLLGISLFSMAAKSADRIEPPLVRARAVEAQEFVLKDKNGRVYAWLSLNGDKYISRATLQFYDEQGRVALTVPAAPALIPAK